MTAIRLLIARLRADRLPILLLAVVVAVTAFLAAAAPRLFANAADAGLRAEVAAADPVERNLELARITRIEALPPSWQLVADAAAEIEAGLPASVRQLLSDGSFFAKSITWRIPDRPAERPGFLNLRLQGGLEDEIRVVEGRLPEGRDETVVAPNPPPALVGFEGEFRAPLFEVALSSATAEELDASVGDVLHLTPDPDDPLVGQFGLPEAAAIEVVGVYEVLDPAADVWNDDFSLERPNRVPVGISRVDIHATALASPDAYPTLMGINAPVRYVFRHVVDAGRLDAGMLEDLVVDLGRMDGQYASFVSGPDPLRTSLQTALPALVASFSAEHRSAESVLVMAAIGPATVALLTMGVLVVAALRRRRPALVLLRGRGGSAPQLLLSHLLEGLLFTVPLAALGAWLAAQAIPARATPTGWFVAGLVALGAIVVLVGASVPAALAPLRHLERGRSAGTGISARRLTFEALAVALAVGGVVLLRQRGLAGSSAVGELPGVDPFLAAVPALVGVAVGIVTVRIYPLPLRAAGLVAAGARSLVPALGLRRAERQSGSGLLPLVVLLVTVAIATFSSTMLATIGRGQTEASWQAVGAAHRVTPREPAAFRPDLSTVPGVEAVAIAYADEASVGIGGSTRATVVALDAAAYEEVTAGTPAATDLPDELIEPVAAERPGTLDAPIPAIVSASLQRTGAGELRVGDTFELMVRGRFANFIAVEARRDIPVLPDDRPAVLVSREHLAAGLIDRQLWPTYVFVRAPASAADELRAAAAEGIGGAGVESQAERLEALRARPLVEAVESGFAVALATALGYAALAVTVALLLSAISRSRETAQLRTLGLAGRQVVALTALEHGPAVLVAALAGLALGVVVGWVVLPGLRLSAFTGSSADPALTVDIGQLAVASVALAAIVVVGVGLAAWLQRRTDPASAVRSAID